MFKNYLKIALRSFLNNKSFSVINISGLTIGFAVVILISIFVKNELSYDRFHKKGEHIYRIVDGNPNDKNSYAGTPAPLGPFLKDKFPEILNYTRICQRSKLVQYKNKKIREKQFFFADPSFFDVFTFPLIQGNSATALLEPNSIVITEDVANRYFGQKNPIGIVLSLDEGFDFIVTAVAQNVPENSHFHFEFLIPFERIQDILHNNHLTSWGAWNYYTYLLLNKNTNPDQLKHKIYMWVEKSFPDRVDNFKSLTYQPIKQIHFKYNRKNIESSFDKKYLNIFVAVAITILIIGCINFINLVTAHSIKRAKEVGLRKTVGANYIQLIMQFLSESILFSMVACILAMILVELMLPTFNYLLGKNLSINYSNSKIYLSLMGLIILTALLAGGYPAFILSSFHPVRVLKGKINGSTSSVFRNALVVFQFTISIALIISTIMIYRQLNYIHTKNLGYEKEHIVNIPLQSRELMFKSETIKTEFLRNKNILSASANTYVPSRFNEHWGGFKWKGMPEENKDYSFWIINADKDFINTFQLDMLEGHDFAQNFEATDKLAFIINESALKQMGWKSAVGKEIIYWGSRNARIVGVARDFHFRSLHHEIAPCAIILREAGNQISLRIKSEDIPSTLNYLKTTWESFTSNIAFDYYFLDEDFDKLYKSELRISRILGYFSMITIFIACIGLYGLTTFMVERRTKELGIRKVLGASTIGLLASFSKDYTKWVLVANLISWPIAYYVMNKWLENFAYRINIGWWTFMLAGGLALIIALLTVSWQAIRVAMANPVEALRYE